jgi:protein TonB
MALCGKSIAASLLLHGTFVALVAGVVMRPSVTVSPAVADESGGGWSLIVEPPGESAPAAETEHFEFAETEVAPPVVSEIVPLDVPPVETPPLVVPQPGVITSTLPTSLPVVAQAPARAKVAGVASRKKSASGTGSGIGTGSGNGAGSGNGKREGVYSAAQYLSTPRPVYPAEAKSAGHSGVVMLLVEIDAAGRASSVRVRKSSGFAELDSSAERAVRGWRFRPAMLDGVAIATRLEVPVRFARQ